MPTRKVSIGPRQPTGTTKTVRSPSGDIEAAQAYCLLTLQAGGPCYSSYPSFIFSSMRFVQSMVNQRRAVRKYNPATNANIGL